MRLIMAAALALALVGCGKAGTPPQSTQAGGFAVANGRSASDAPPAPANAPEATTVDQSSAGEQHAATPPISPTASQTLFLAYAYQVGVELPSARIAPVMDAHVRACQAAGPRLCQLIGANRSGDPDSEVNGTLDIRGEPTWLHTFMGGIGAQVNAAGGRTVSQATTTEDLTRSIVDTEAHLRAETALRDRLQRLLESRPGRLSDLLDVERELARVQGDLDGTQSNLAVMRARVDMSELTVTYQSAPRPVGSDTFEPLRDALAGFLGVVVIGFAAIVTIIAGALPFAIVLMPIIWGLLRWRERRGGRWFGPRGNAPTPPAE